MRLATWNVHLLVENQNPCCNFVNCNIVFFLLIFIGKLLIVSKTIYPVYFCRRSVVQTCRYRVFRKCLVCYEKVFWQHLFCNFQDICSLKLCSDSSASDYNADEGGFTPHTGRPFLGHATVQSINVSFGEQSSIRLSFLAKKVIISQFYKIRIRSFSVMCCQKINELGTCAILTGYNR